VNSIAKHQREGQHGDGVDPAQLAEDVHRVAHRLQLQVGGAEQPQSLLPARRQHHGDQQRQPDRAAQEQDLIDRERCRQAAHAERHHGERGDRAEHPHRAAQVAAGGYGRDGGGGARALHGRVVSLCLSLALFR